MTIPSRLQTYLDARGVQYEVCAHHHSSTSAQTARSAHVPAHELAKAVLVEDDEGGCLMVVLPADRKLRLGELSRVLGRRNLRLAEEDRIVGLFAGCDPGAVPSLGMPWGVETLVDEQLEAAPTVYVECGDHECLLRLSHEQFHALMGASLHGEFSSELVH